MMYPVRIGTCAILVSANFCFGAMVFTTVGDHAIEDANCEIGVVGYTPGWASITLRKHFRVTGGWSAMEDGRIRGDIRLECVNPCELQVLCLSARFTMAPVFNREWRADDKVRVLSEKPVSGNRLGSGKAREYVLPLPQGKVLRMEFDNPVAYYAQDSRKWGPNWGLRLGENLARRTYAPGDVVDFKVVLSTVDGMCLETPKQWEIREGADWTRLDYRRHPAKGSALDWSGMGFQDAPAGKHGWLKSVGGHFEFEALPGVEQRFYGVNLCYDANYPEHDAADMLVERLVRCGYNSIRVHHHDGRWVRDDDSRDRLDYLIARCLEHGIYVTTDLYVSRRPLYRDIGIDKDGPVASNGEYKRAVATNDLAFKDWCVFTERFLKHVNPYSGRSYLDEPGLPLISLVNEGGESKVVWEKCSAFVRSLGSRALLSNDNNGSRHGEGEGLTPQYDYVDNHFYVDHPEFLNKDWQLPSHCPNANPIHEGGPAMFRRGWAKGATKPYTITEWNFSGPGRYRAVGGILTGALAAGQEWDGLWRFAYSHSDKGWGDSPTSAPGYFDCVSDPLMAASDRASVCLYLRGDADWEGRTLSRPDSGGSRSCATVGVEDAQERVPPVLRLDKGNGSMAIATPRTCGGFAESGIINAGPLTFSVCTNAVAHHIVPTTLWVSSLDGRPVEASTRLLLVHLTDVQGNGVRYADRLRRTLLSWGKGCLAEAGSAKVALRLDAPEGFVVHELDTAGNRIGKLPVSTSGGVLSFEVSTCGPHGVRIYYEIVRLEKLPKK